MKKPNVYPVVLALVTLAACERADSIAPDGSAANVPVLDHAPGASLAAEPRLHAEVVDHVDPPPPPTQEELRIGHLRHWYGLLSMEAQQGVSQMCRWNEANPCGMMLPTRPPRIDPRPAMLSALATSQRPLADAYCDAMYEHTACDTPLVVAFDGEAIAFDEHWPTATTPWLALDRDGDGAITSRAELFGDATVLANDVRAHNGFEALAALDDNRDGVVDRADATFSRLLLWTDRDGDHRSSASELRPASDLVVSIPLANTLDVRCTPSDDCEGERGTIAWRTPDGTLRQGALVDVYIH